MKRISRLLVLAIVLVTVLVPLLSACNNPTSGSSGGDKLVVYNWEDYIDPDILDDFADYYREVTGRALEITYTTFDTNETMMTKVLKKDANVDLICPSEYAIEKLMTAGMVKNLTEVEKRLSEQFDELGITLDYMHGNVEKEVMSAISNMFSAIPVGDKTLDMTEYMVPYMWGTLGILYNRKYVSEEELEQYGWGIFWNEGGNPDIEGKILVKDSIRDTYCAAVLYLKEYGKLPSGVSSVNGKTYEELSVAELINCTDDVLLDAAEQVLTEQRDHIAGYEVDFGKDDMINEIVYVDLAWSGDALWAIEESYYDEKTDEYMLGYYVPEIGSNIWYDGWIIPTTSQNDLAAMMFIDYMCRPESGARNSGYIGYTSAVSRQSMMESTDALDALVDAEYMWYANEEECSVWLDPSDPAKMYFRYEWVEGEPYYLNPDGTEAEVTDESGLTEAALETDEDGNYLIDGNTIYDPDAISLFFFDEGRYPTISDNLGVMRDFGASNDKVVQIWERAKAGTDTPWELIWCLVAVVLIVGIALGAYFLKEYLKRRSRKIKQSE